MEQRTLASYEKPLNIFSSNEFFKELWRALPIWFLYLEAIGLLHFEMANVDPEKYRALGHTSFSFAITAVFPLFWVIFYYILRIRESSRLNPKGYYLLVIPSILIALPLVIFLWYSAFPIFRLYLSEKNLRVLFEYMQLFWIILFLVHAASSRGWHKFTTFYIVGFVYGVLLENTGIVLGYFYEPHYKYYLGRLPAPFATMMGWCLVFYCCIWTAEYFREKFPWFKRCPLRSALLTAAVAISLDIQLDPLASLSGVFWRWNDALPAFFLTVPFCNYAAWFGAFLPFSYAYFYLLDREDLSEIQRNWKLFVHVPLIAVVAGLIWLTLMTIWECGFSGPTYDILSAFIEKIVPYPT